MTDICRQDPRGNRQNTGYFTKDTLPSEECDVHVKVNICTSCNKEVNEFCPESSIKTKILLKIDRSYLPKNFKPKPTDAAYVYVPGNYCTCHTEPEEEIPELPELPELPVIPDVGGNDGDQNTGDDDDPTTTE